MKTTVKEQKTILSIIKQEVENGSGIKSICAFIKGYGSPDNIFICGNKIQIRVSHEYTYLTAKDGF